MPLPANHKALNAITAAPCRTAHVNIPDQSVSPYTHAQARWDDLGPSVIEGGFKIGVASDFWNRYEEDILLAKGLGACRYCFGTVQAAIHDGSASSHRHELQPV